MNNIYETLDRMRQPLTGAFPEIEREAKLPHKCFSHHFMWCAGKKNGRPFPRHAVGNLLRYLTRIFGGVKIGDWYVVSEPGAFSHTGFRHDDTSIRVIFDEFDICEI